MNAHPLSAKAADDAPLQKRWAFAGGPRLPGFSESQRVLREALLIRLKLLPGDVTGMEIGNHELPFRPGNFLVACLPSGRRRVRTRP